MVVADVVAANSVFCASLLRKADSLFYFIIDFLAKN
jgi:hypothetical protein